MKTYKRPKTILRKAADYIEENGLHKEGFFLGSKDFRQFAYGHPCCAEGAINLMGAGNPATFSKVSHRALGMMRKSVGDHVSTWNDKAERTQAEVVAKLREVGAG